MKLAHRQALTMIADSREGVAASTLAAHGFDDKLQAELVGAELARKHSIRIEAGDRNVEVIHITITEAGLRALAGQAQDIIVADEPMRGPASSSHKVPMISIIDDDVLVRDALHGLVQSLGYGALTFESADEFLQSGRIAETACLILDVQMPDMGGLELQDRLLAEGRDTPVIFITALPGKLLRARALDAGASGFLRKPVLVEELIECLKVALARVE